jgi:hypothetical protein
VARAIELARAAEDSVERCIPPPVAVVPEAPLPAPAPDTVIAAPVSTECSFARLITSSVAAAAGTFRRPGAARSLRPAR